MELAVAFLADAVIVQDGKFYVWGGGIDTVYAPGFPTAANVSLLARVTFEPSECDRPHTVEVNTIDEDGKPVAPSMPPQAVIPQRDLADSTLQVGNLTVLTFRGLPFPKPSKIIFSILVDGRELGSIKLRAVQASPAPAGWQKS